MKYQATSCSALITAAIGLNEKWNLSWIALSPYFWMGIILTGIVACVELLLNRQLRLINVIVIAIGSSLVILSYVKIAKIKKYIDRANGEEPSLNQGEDAPLQWDDPEEVLRKARKEVE